MLRVPCLIKKSSSFKEVLVKVFDRLVCRLRTKDITSIKVLWRNQKVE